MATIDTIASKINVTFIAFNARLLNKSLTIPALPYALGTERNVKRL
jgi:hypothetical protein